MKITAIKELEKIIADRKPSIIAIDGIYGSGKTTLAKELADRFGFGLIHSDNFLNKKTGEYYNAIRFDELRDQINSYKEPIIIEGCCLLKILKRVGCTSEITVYVQRLQYGHWIDEEDFVTTGDIEAFIEKRNADIYEFSVCHASALGEEFDESDTDCLSGLTKDLIRYHSAYEPHAVANVIFAREISGS